MQDGVWLSQSDCGGGRSSGPHHSEPTPEGLSRNTGHSDTPPYLHALKVPFFALKVAYILSFGLKKKSSCGGIFVLRIIFAIKPFKLGGGGHFW